MEKLLERLKGQLIVSCQAYPGEALYGSHLMTAMANAAKAGGAAAIRANSPQDVAAIKEGCGLPVIGIWKRSHTDSDIYITPCLSDAETLFAAGADIVALDATGRLRPGGETLEGLVSGVRRQPGRLTDGRCFDLGRRDRGRSVRLRFHLDHTVRLYSLQLAEPSAGLPAAGRIGERRTGSGRRRRPDPHSRGSRGSLTYRGLRRRGRNGDYPAALGNGTICSRDPGGRDGQPDRHDRRRST